MVNCEHPTGRARRVVFAPRAWPFGPASRRRLACFSTFADADAIILYSHEPHASSYCHPHARDHGEVRSRDRAGGACAVEDADESVLRLFDALRRPAQFQYLSGVFGITRSVAGAESPRAGAGDSRRAGAGM